MERGPQLALRRMHQDGLYSPNLYKLSKVVVPQIDHDCICVPGALSTNITNIWGLSQTTVAQSDNFMHIGLTWTAGKKGW